MKLQVLNGSFGNVLAAAATIALMVSFSAPAQAQGQWGSNSCYYTPQGGKMVVQGCAFATGGHQYYYDIATKISTDYATGYKYFVGQDGRPLIYTTAGWTDAQAYFAQLGAANKPKDPNFVAEYGSGTVGGVYEGTGSMTLGPLANVSPYPEINALKIRAAREHTWSTPDNIIYVQPR
jgi:hypothetical protein